LTNAQLNVTVAKLAAVGGDEYIFTIANETLSEQCGGGALNPQYFPTRACNLGASDYIIEFTADIMCLDGIVEIPLLTEIVNATLVIPTVAYVDLYTPLSPPNDYSSSYSYPYTGDYSSNNSTDFGSAAATTVPAVAPSLPSSSRASGR
jgi:hypothetical protein